jgi:predicted dehydrogenase
MRGIKYKICMVGLGSIGKRHLHNIVKVLKNRSDEYEIDALRSSNRKLDAKEDKLISKQFFDVKDLPNDYDVVFITNPTNVHYKAITDLIDRTRHMFIEKPVFENCSYDLNNISLKPQGVYYVACPLRYKAVLEFVKNQIVSEEHIVSCRVMYSSYLPNWRKGVDYREIYSAHKDMGGGVTRDLIHEWDYCIDIFGKPKRVYGLRGHLSNLEIDSDDVSVYIADYDDMILEIHLDYIGRRTERKMELYTDDSRIEVDLIKNTVTAYRADNVTNTYILNDNDFYVDELEHFFDCIEGKCDNNNTIEKAYETLKIALQE